MYFLFTHYSLGSTPLLILFGLSTSPMLAYLSRFIPSSWRLHLDSNLTQAINLTTQPCMFPFFSTYLGTTCFISYWFWNCPSTSYWEFGLDTSLKDSIIVRCSVTVLLLFSYLPPYNYCRSIDSRIRVLLHYPGPVSAFLLFWLVRRS